jgi:hypothetical protein
MSPVCGLIIQIRIRSDSEILGLFEIRNNLSGSELLNIVRKLKIYKVVKSVLDQLHTSLQCRGLQGDVVYLS